MIKMLGLIEEDYFSVQNSRQNKRAWEGYQISMRILEATLCTLLAIIATTPLRYDQMGKKNILSRNSEFFLKTFYFRHLFLKKCYFSCQIWQS